jgi:type I restriction enzyme S subunit
VNLTQCHVGIDLEFEFRKRAAGPFDEEIIKVESLAGKMSWFKTHKRKGGFGYYYRRGQNIRSRCDAAVTILGSQKNEMDRLLSFFNKMNTDQAEIFDTVYAVWNDMLIDGIKPTEDKIREDFYAWSDEKKRFTPKQVSKCVGWIKDNGFVPTGTGLKTQAV